MRWDDDFLGELDRMQGALDRLFDRFTFGLDDDNIIRPGGSKASGYRRPVSSFSEKDGKYVLRLEIPGVKKEDIKLGVRDGGIEIKAESSSEKKEGEKDERVYERSYARFYQFFSLPADADAENCKASYSNGVLEVKIPRKKESDEKIIRVE